MRREHLVRAARIGFVLLVAGVFIEVAVRNASQLRHVSLHVHPVWFGAASRIPGDGPRTEVKRIDAPSGVKDGWLS